MKVIAINGSARENGNTRILIERVFKRLEEEGIETELISLSKNTVLSCKACFTCGGKAKCTFGDQDIFNSIFEKMKAADGIILASPSYSANISSNMQALLERASVICDMNPDLLTHKVGTSIATERRAGALNTIDAMNHFFLNHEMYIAGATYWNIGTGKLPGEVEKDEEALNIMDNLGENMAYLLKKLKGDNRE